MSLIDDALKRVQEAGQGSGEKRAERPWVPTPMPDAGLARRRRLVRQLGIAGAVLTVAAAGAILVLRRAPEAAPEHPAAPIPQAQPEQRPDSSAPPAAAPGSIPEPAAPEDSRTLLPSSSPRSAVAPGAAEAARPPESVRSAETERAEEARPPAHHRSRALADGESFAGEVSLPDGQRIELGGIVYSETDPRALLNDRIVAVGAYVEGFTVSRIESDRVALEKDGLTIYLLLK